MDRETAYALPRTWIKNRLDELHISKSKDEPYWHIVLVRSGEELALRGYRSGRDYPISEFAVKLNSAATPALLVP